MILSLPGINTQNDKIKIEYESDEECSQSTPFSSTPKTTIQLGGAKNIHRTAEFASHFLPLHDLIGGAHDESKQELGDDLNKQSEEGMNLSFDMNSVSDVVEPSEYSDAYKATVSSIIQALEIHDPLGPISEQNEQLSEEIPLVNPPV